MNEALSKNLFTDTAQLYQLAKSALQSLYISQGMADTAALAGLAMSLKDFNLSNLYSQTVPVVSAPSDPNRSVWTDEAETLWEKMRADKPIYGSDESDANTDANTAGNSDGSSDNSTDGTDNTDNMGTDNTGSQEAAQTPDPVTGLITQADGTLIDPNTGGTVDPEDGSIHDALTGQYIGLADRYLNATVCDVPAKN